MLAVELETVRNVAFVATVAVIVLGLALALVVKAILGKLVVLAVVVVAALALWTNRTNLSDCAGQVQAAVTDGGAPPTCTFLGLEIDVPLP